MDLVGPEDLEVRDTGVAAVEGDTVEDGNQCVIICWDVQAFGAVYKMDGNKNERAGGEQDNTLSRKVAQRQKANRNEENSFNLASTFFSSNATFGVFATPPQTIPSVPSLLVCS